MRTRRWLTGILFGLGLVAGGVVGARSATAQATTTDCPQYCADTYKACLYKCLPLDDAAETECERKCYRALNICNSKCPEFL